MTEGPELKITIASDTDYDQLVADIYCDSKFVALISQDDGPDRLKLVFPERSNPYIIRSVGLDWFMDAVQKAKDKLLNG